MEQRWGAEDQEDHDGRDEGRQEIHDGSLNFLRRESAFVSGEPIDGGPGSAT